MKIQLDLTDELNKRLKMHKAKHGFSSLGDALIDILKRFLAMEKKQ